MAVTDWTIISAGPSAERVTDAWLLDGPVVAINRAIGLTDVKVDIWAVWDDPGRILPSLLDPAFLKDISSVWVGAMVWGKIHKQNMGLMNDGEEEALSWRRHIDPLVGFRCMRLGAIPYKTGMRNSFTLVCACEKAVELGARRIRIMGADMDGPWEDEPHPGEHGDREVWDRWGYEREQIQNMIQSARENAGVEIELAHN